MTFREIAALAMDEWEDEETNQKVGGESRLTADGMTSVCDADGSGTTPSGTTPGTPTGAPTGAGAPQGAAATLQFNLQKHLDQYHGGQQPKGACKYMDKVAQQAKALGVADKVPGLNGGEGGSGKSVDDTEVKNSAEWKQYTTDRDVIDATFQAKLQALGVADPQLNGSGYNEEQMKVVDEWHKAVEDRRDKYLNEALGDAEAHCVDQLASIIDAGGERAEKALKLAEEIAAKYGEGDPRHDGAKKMIERGEWKKQREEFEQRKKEFKKKEAEQALREKQLKEQEEELAKAQEKERLREMVRQEQMEKAEGARRSKNEGEVKVGDKTYVDLSGKDFWTGMAEAFKAGWQGKEIITDWDKMSGRWDEVKKGMTEKQRKNYEGLSGGVKDALQEMANEAAAAQFEKHLAEDSGLTDEQKAYVQQLYADWARDDKNKAKMLKELNRYLKEQGISDGGGKKKKEEEKESDLDKVDHANGDVLTGAATDDGRSIDTSFLGKGTFSTGVLNKESEAKQKIVDAVQKVGGVSLDPNAITVKPGVSSTKMSFSVAGQGFNKSALIDAIETGMGAVVGTKDDNGKDKLPVAVSYDKDTDTINLSFQNDKKGSVSFADIVNNDKWKEFIDKNKGRGAFSLGVKEDGTPDMYTLDDMIHMMIAGTTGSGKSVKMHTLVNSLFAGSSPDDLRVIMVDPKGLEFNKYDGDPHMLSDTVTNMDEAADKFNWLVDENENRAKLFAKAKVRTLADYNRLGAEGKLPEGMPKHLPRIAMVVDELADLMAQHGKDVEKALSRLSAKARSQGINLILATQRPDANTLSGTIKSNIPSTVGMSVANPASARVVGINGLDKMPKKGPYAVSVNGEEPTYGEGAFMPDDEIDKMVEASKNAYGVAGGGSAPTPATSSPSSSRGPTGGAPKPTPPSGGGGSGAGSGGTSGSGTTRSGGGGTSPTAAPASPPPETGSAPAESGTGQTEQTEGATKTVPAGATVTNLTQNQVKRAEALTQQEAAGVKQFQAMHQPKSAAQKAAYDKVLGDDSGFADDK